MPKAFGLSGVNPVDNIDVTLRAILDVHTQKTA